MFSHAASQGGGGGAVPDLTGGVEGVERLATTPGPVRVLSGGEVRGEGSIEPPKTGERKGLN